MHLTDPVKALMNAYTALRDGGELYIDHFSIRGLDIDEFRNALKQRGYLFELVGERGLIDCFHIIKTHPTLDLPIAYQTKTEDDFDRRFMQYKWI